MEQTIAGLNVERRGSGPPLLLIHGIAHRWQAWTAMLDSLARHHDVVAVDLPGFGKSAPLPDGTPPSLPNLADALERVLDELGWNRPDVAGNSLGGWLSYELARRGRARSATGLAPAGLWHGRKIPRQLPIIFRNMHRFTNRFPRAIPLMRFRPVRTVASFGFFGRPWKIPADIAVDDARNFARDSLIVTAEALEAGEFFHGGREIDAPMTIVFFGLDPLIRRRQTSLAELPSSLNVLWKRRCGHVPMWDDPAWCVGAIRDTVARGREGPAAG